MSLEVFKTADPLVWGQPDPSCTAGDSEIRSGARGRSTLFRYDPLMFMHFAIAQGNCTACSTGGYYFKNLSSDQLQVLASRVSLPQLARGKVLNINLPAYGSPIVLCSTLTWQG